MGYFIISVKNEGRPIKMAYRSTIKGARTTLRTMNRNAGWQRISRCHTGGLETEWARNTWTSEYDTAPYALIEELFYDIKYPAGTRKTKNLMTGEVIEIPDDTPYCCDPGTERYWSM